MKAILNDIQPNGLTGVTILVTFTNGGSVVDSERMEVSVSSAASGSDVRNAINTAILAYATAHSYSMASSDIIDPHQVLSQSEADGIKLIPYGYVNGTRKNNLFTLTKDVSTTSGSIALYLTDDGLITGNALFSEIHYVKIDANDTSASYEFGWSFSGVTLTITAKKLTFSTVTLLATLLLAGTSMANVPNGTSLKVTVTGK